MADQGQLEILKQGVAIWNKWRKENPGAEIDLSKTSLKGRFLQKVMLRGANLSETDFSEASLAWADLSEANLFKANLYAADLYQADLRGANLIEAILVGAQMIRTKIEKAKVSGSSIYSINVWDLEGEFAEEYNLVITDRGAPVITVDDIEVAQFVYLLLNNQKIRDVINTITTKAVLILGRFTSRRKRVLDALRKALRERGYVPILFDFKPSPRRDLTETIQLLANMSKFIVADITEAKSIPQELSHIIPFLPSVPVQPILLASKKEYAMFEHWRSFDTVLPEFLYRDARDLIDNLETRVILPVDAWRNNQDKVALLENQIQELQEKIAKSEQSKHR